MGIIFYTPSNAKSKVVEKRSFLIYDKVMDFAENEEKILEFWKKNKIFEKSLEKGDGEFVFYDGPPFATGLPHYGHILASIIKDAIPRYQTMKGKRVPRKWGWDCHGLPIENLIEKELSLKNKKEIEDYGIEKFNQKARESVLRYADEWKKIIPRIGRWVDMENDYKTMDSSYIESVWGVFKTLYDKKLIYEGYKSMHICPRCETTLSNFEVTQNYQDIKDIAVTAKFELEDDPSTGSGQDRTFVLAWTTTPWTLPGNVALAINPDIEYVKVKSENNFYILAKNRLEEIFKDTEYKIEKEFKGEVLVGKKYKPLFSYYANDEKLENRENGWKIYSADFVNTDEGTGIVHIAPAFGEEDMALGQQEKLPFVQHVGMDGKFKKEVKDFAGMAVKPKDNPQATDIEILKFLAKENKIFSKEKIEHSYPFCWRCDTPLLNYAASSWFVAVTKIKDDLIKNNQKINWVPAHLKDGRFGKWLEGAHDWAVSRSRYWGAPLPVWKCEKCEAVKVVGSVDELEKLSGQKPEDLHRPHIDEIKFDCECAHSTGSGQDGKMKRVSEVFDCWFESGSMPYSQEHFPADFIAEGVDQTRGWFYTLLVLSVALRGQPAFKNVVANGIILSEDGQKMSKRLNNYPDPMYIVQKYGADSLRFYLLSSSAVRAENLNFSEKGVEEVSKKIVSKIKNTISFYEMYAREISYNRTVSEDPLDKWILLKLRLVGLLITKNLDNYNLDKASWQIALFVEDFSNWYIRRSRDRFKENNDGAISTLKYVLEEFSKIVAPFMPFVAEEVYQVVKYGEVESVHLENWITFEKLSDKDHNLLLKMALVRNISSHALDSRLKNGIKVRQPLKTLKVNRKEYGDWVDLEEEYLNIIKDEINVKEIVYDDQIEDRVKLDIEITEELKTEGMVRDLTRAIQDLRKKMGLKPHDEIELVVETDKAGEEFLNKFSDEIKKGTNTNSIKFSENNGEAIKINKLSFKIKI